MYIPAIDVLASGPILEAQQGAKWVRQV